ncbi:MAG: DUF4835 family protein [Algicola sp.]|nr:DUF4835 family protein [Algicola sp.]
MNRILIVLMLLLSWSGFSQELNCNVVVNAQQTGNENLQIFKTLEKQLAEFVNNTKWTDKTFEAQEKISCGIFINITEYNNDVYKASIQVQSSRPVFGSTYSTPVYNINDKDFTFKYLEFQNLIFSPNQFQSNLVSVLAFHIYMILGVDADTFAPNGGDVYFKQAQTIANYSQQEGSKGWRLEDGLQSRYALIDNISASTYKEFREVMYAYHRKGLDEMHSNVKLGKSGLVNALNSFNALHARRPNSYLLRVFFDAKADEIEQIFTDGPSVEITELLSTLNKVAPMHSSKWRNITF